MTRRTKATKTTRMTTTTTTATVTPNNASSDHTNPNVYDFASASCVSICCYDELISHKFQLKVKLTKYGSQSCKVSPSWFLYF